LAADGLSLQADVRGSHDCRSRGPRRRQHRARLRRAARKRAQTRLAMTMPLIRKVRDSDYPAWAELWAGYNAFYGRSGETALPLEIVNATWSRFLDPADSMTAFVAEDGAQLLGLAHILFHASTISIAPVCYLPDLFVAPHQRGRRIGESLLDAAATEAKA